MMASDSEPTFPLVERLPATFDSARAFRKLCQQPRCVFLDSSLRDKQLGRYSYIAVDPYDVLDVPAGLDGRLQLDGLRRKMFEIATPAQPGLPPFQGGAAGLFGYELSHTFERLPPAEHDEFQIPVMSVGLYDVVFAFDHQESVAWIVSQGFPETDKTDRHQRAADRLAEAKTWLAVKDKDSPKGNVFEPCALHAPAHELKQYEKIYSNFTADEYRAAVAETIEYIRAGDIFQANLSQRLLSPAHTASATFYLRLREKTTATFAGYFDGGEFQIMSASPERFVQVSDGLVEARPIKGTRPKVASPLADMYSGKALQASEKDRAENVMIVDLIRNDISPACEPASVKVPILCGLESYGYVQHLVSVVQGKLRANKTAIDLMESAFPGGSITGAPKIRAMEIITELERVARGAYCGSLGFISASGDMDLNILIRTVTAKNGWWQFPVGGGIVADSDAEREYAETWHKAVSILRAL